MKCSFCGHPDRLELEQLSAEGVAVRALERLTAERYPNDPALQLDKSSISRHLSKLGNGGCVSMRAHPEDQEREPIEPEGNKSESGYCWSQADAALRLAREAMARSDAFRLNPSRFISPELVTISRRAYVVAGGEVAEALRSEWSKYHSLYLTWRERAELAERTESWALARSRFEKLVSGAWVADDDVVEARSLGEQLDAADARYASLRALNYASLRARGDAEQAKQLSITIAKRLDAIVAERIEELRAQREGQEKPTESQAATAAVERSET